MKNLTTNRHVDQFHPLMVLAKRREALASNVPTVTKVHLEIEKIKDQVKNQAKKRKSILTTNACQSLIK